MRPDFFVFGVGGAGNRILNQIKATQFANVKTVAVDTDKESLDSTRADIHILLGNNRIKAWGEGNPAEARGAAVGALSEIKALIKPTDIVFIVAGMGGGAGSGAASQVAMIARLKGALVIAMITYPSRIQEKNINNANEGIKHLLHYADSVIVVDFDRYEHLPPPHLTMSQLYSDVNRIIIDVIFGLIGSLTIPSLLNADYDDLKAIFGDKGVAIILSGESDEKEKNKNESVVRNCLNSRSCDIDYRCASGCFVLITAGNDLNTYDAGEIERSLTFELDPHASVVTSANINETMEEGRIHVYAIVTGIRGRIEKYHVKFDDQVHSKKKQTGQVIWTT
jgi:cell division protein FtsZ